MALLLPQLQVSVWLRPEDLECWPALRKSQGGLSLSTLIAQSQVGFWEMPRHIPQNWTVISNTGNVVTCQTFRSKDEVQSVGKKKSLKCDILNLWLMIKQKIKLYYTLSSTAQTLLEAKSKHGVPSILFH